MKAGWEMKKLGEVCVIDKCQVLNKNLPYVGLEHIESHTGRFIGSINPIVVKSSTFTFSHEHLLYGRLRPYLNKVMLPNFKGHCSTEIFPIKPKDTLSREFLIYWFLMDSTVELIDATSTGARMPRASMNAILHFEIPIPPLPEQQHIVAVLDEAFAAIATARANAERNLKNARALFDSYLNAVFVQRGDGWVEKRLGDIAQVKGGKRVPKGFKLLVEPTDFPYLRVTDFTDSGTIDIMDLRYISSVVHSQIKNYIISSNDLYISIAGTIGKTGIIPEELDGANLTESACRLVFKPDISNRFVYYFTITSSFVEQSGLNTRTAAQPKLALSRLATIQIGIPSIQAQQRIVAKLDALCEETQRLEKIYRQKLVVLDELKKSILHQAFTGEL